MANVVSGLHSITLTLSVIQIGYLQWKYRIEATEKIATVEGVYGEGPAKDSTFNNVVNPKGCRNTNKPGDLMVESLHFSNKDF